MKLKTKSTMFALSFLLLGAVLGSAGGCDSEDDCIDGAYRCTGTVLEQCKANAFEVLEDCASLGSDIECHADHGHCMKSHHSSGHHMGGGHEGGHHMGGGHEGGGK